MNPELEQKLFDELEEAAQDLYQAIFLSGIHLLFPIDMLVRHMVTKKTFRNNSPFNFSQLMDIVLFFIVCQVIYDINYYSNIVPPDLVNNQELHMFKPEHFFMLNIIMNIQGDLYRLDGVLSMLVLCTWLKLVFSFKFTSTFGPLFTMVEKMTIDLGTFMILWLVLLLMFACVATLAFG